MTRGLLSRLRSPTSRRDDVSTAVVEHLKVLLNTRHGESPAALGYGIPDFSDVVHAFPMAIQVLQRAIRETILEYEPRLRQVQVRHIPTDDPLTLHFEISGRLEGQRLLKLQTRVNAGGKLDVY